MHERHHEVDRPVLEGVGLAADMLSWLGSGSGSWLGLGFGFGLGLGLGLTVRVGVRLYVLAGLKVVGAKGGLVAEVRVEHDPAP